jgi:hypothetical protein
MLPNQDTGISRTCLTLGPFYASAAASIYDTSFEVRQNQLLGRGLISLPNEKRQDRPHAIFSDIEAGAKSSYSEIIVSPPINHHKKII